MKHSLEHLREIFSYDPETGLVCWKIRARSDMPAGTEAGSLTRENYVEINYQRTRYFAHNLAWALYFGAWPSMQLDHKDGNPTNNRIDNLRLATASQNKANSRRYRNNTSGCKGVERHKDKWRARITVNHKRISLGLFATQEEAAAAYLQAASKYFGNFARAA